MLTQCSAGGGRRIITPQTSSSSPAPTCCYFLHGENHTDPAHLSLLHAGQREANTACRRSTSTRDYLHPCDAIKAGS
uniref:Uncharacterized protein n=1 Tax=Knipowitschia caucasica TaxID=637954 RepID=A0AAV2KYL0_KNICA